MPMRLVKRRSAGGEAARLPRLGAGVLVAALLLAPFRQALGADAILRVADGKIMDLPGLVADLAGTRVVFFGELHNQPGHHRAQLDLIRAMDRTRPVAVALEMFEAESQGELDRWTAGESTIDDFLPVYYRNWNNPWELYRDILLYARERRLPMAALNVPEEITTRVAREGFDSLSAEQRKRLPGVSCVVDEAYERFIRDAVGDPSHGKANFRFFCEAQMVWDTTMARNLDEFLRKDRRNTAVVVLAGSGHSWKPGIPARLAERNQAPQAVILPEIPGNLEPGGATAKEADYLWLGITELEER